MEPATGAYADEICTCTEAYLDRVTACTALLPDALDAYDTDPETFADAVARVATRESECDAALRDLRTLVGESMEPNYTGVYLRIEDVARLYAAIDGVPNCAERFVRELHAIGPALDDDLRAILREMAALIVEATVELATVTTAYVESLVGESEVAVTAAAEELSALESDCDGLKYDALTHAFDAYSTADALVIRELVSTLDAAMDAVEDVGDQLLFLSSGDL